jgi:hypothetical protein
MSGGLAPTIALFNGGMSMARMLGRGAGEETVSGYFRKVFAEKPSLLFEKSNAELLERWLKDHPGHSVVPEKVKANLANLKSQMRKKARLAGKGKRGRPPKHHDGAAVAASAPAVSHSSTKKLDLLEENIDDCLSLAKHLDRDGLENVIKLLRRARNAVVWKIGQ